MSRRTVPHPWANRPELLTSISSPWQMYRKADWNFGRYEDAVFARPCDFEAVMYTAIDFSVSVVALRDWTRKKLVQDVRQNGKILPTEIGQAEGFLDFVAGRVPWQPAVEAIANTAKHAEYRDNGWEKGLASPASFFPDYLRAEHEACSSGTDLFTFMHKHREITWWDLALRQHGDENATSGYEALGDVLDQWGDILKALGYQEE